MITTLIKQKGSGGNTLLMLHAANELVGRGKRITLIDADPQGLSLKMSQRRAGAGLPRLFGSISQCVIFAHVAQSGRISSEVNCQSPAAREIAALTAEIEGLGIGRAAP